MTRTVVALIERGPETRALLAALHEATSAEELGAHFTEASNITSVCKVGAVLCASCVCVCVCVWLCLCGCVCVAVSVATCGHTWVAGTGDAGQ